MVSLEKDEDIRNRRLPRGNAMNGRVTAILLVIIIAIIAGGLWYHATYQTRTLSPSMTYKNQKYGFSFAVPSGANVVNLDEAAAGGYINKITADSRDVATIAVTTAASTKDWFDYNWSIALDAHGNVVNPISYVTVNGNDAGIVGGDCITLAVIHHGQLVVVIRRSSLGNQDCSIMKETVDSFQW